MNMIDCTAVIAAFFCAQALGQPLRGGIPATLPTVQVNESGQLTGHYSDTRFMKCFLSELQQKIHWKSYPTARLIQEVKNNKLDIIFPMGFTQERRDQLIQSEHVELIEDYWVYKGAKPDVTAKSVSIGVKLGSPQEFYVKQQDYENIVRHNDYVGLYKMLLAGRVQVIALPDMAYIGLVDQFGKEKTQFTPFLQRGYGFYLSPKSTPEFIKKINEVTVTCRL